MRVGIGTMPLDWGRCSPWLFNRMKRLAQAISIEIVDNFGVEEFLRRLSDVIWLQSFGCVLGWDYNSSGLGIVTLASLKEGLRGLESELGLFVCGGKGQTSRKTPDQIQKWGEFLGWPKEKIDKLVYASKISAKIDSSCLQDGFQIYAHDFIFTKSGQWAVIQQGMNTNIQRARRYHWLSSAVQNFTELPHTGIISGAQVKPLNLVARESRENKEISIQLIKEEPKTFLKNIKLISEKPNALIQQRRISGFTQMELRNVEFHHHPVEKEKFDLKRLEKTIFAARSENPENFEKLLALKGVGPKTIRALSLIAEVVYNTPPSYQDPARYSFCVGGKDHVPRPIDKRVYDQVLDIMEKGIKKSKISNQEKIEAQRKLKTVSL